MAGVLGLGEIASRQLLPLRISLPDDLAKAKASSKH